MSIMDSMVKSIKKEKRQQMMTDMMPKMMEGIDMVEFMPQMMIEMFKDVTPDDIIQFLRNAIKNRDKFKVLTRKIREANLMRQMMFKSYKSKLSFDETVTMLNDNAIKVGWIIPDSRDMKEFWTNQGIEGMIKATTLYICNPNGGFSVISEHDENIPMITMMPLGITVYETKKGEIRIGCMNLGTMATFFPGAVNKIFTNGAKNIEKALEGII